ncbi:hypothetical protein QZH41_003654 [Actinostola sp. cb2023]|nr:hypothetical protein QZH41_003654 [Actinostola sp. cb2023]
MRSKKRDGVLEQKRKIGKQGSPPHIIALVPLSSSSNSQAALELFTSCDEESSVFPSSNSTTIVSPNLKQCFTLLALKYGDLYSVLDAIKVADTVVFLTSAENPVDSFTDQCLSAIFAQGLPATFHGIQGLDNCPAKKKNDIKKGMMKIIEKRFPKEKTHTLDTPQEALVALRLIANQHQRLIHFRDNRPHLLANNVAFEPNSEDTNKGTLKVTGYLRGKALSANRLVHLAGFGDFQMSQIEVVADPYPSQIKGKTSKAGESSMPVDDESIAMDEGVRVVDKANPAFQESLQSEVELDPMEGEQTWPTEDELKEAEDYQASWITEGENDDDDNEESDNDDDDDDEADDEFIRDIKQENDDDDDESMKMDDEEEYESLSVSGGPETDNAKYDDDIDVNEELIQLEKLRSERENELFPDEMDTPKDVPARIRFQKFRGLKSFRTSAWDPKENLPTDYSSSKTSIGQGNELCVKTKLRGLWRNPHENGEANYVRMSGGTHMRMGRLTMCACQEEPT